MHRFWIGHRFWISLPIALALAAPAAYAGKLDSVEQAAKTFVAKKESRSGGSHGLGGHAIAGAAGHGKVSQIVGKGKKLIGK
ncbi:MAG TPA: hypothetical protein VHX19_24395 [Stellaceae bacterium]|nr:hypothetical protein [Stellaceae bacterium]